MTIILKRVELSNIRSHKHVVFEPEAEGITAISGPNGTGKSTIVDSIAWVLYGTKPTGVSKVSAIYREDALFGDDRCFAIVEIEVENQYLKIERRMVNKNGAVECEVWEKITAKDGTEKFKQVAGPAVSHAEPYIRKRLRMDEKGFLSAILVQQKQVDQLISASPRERAQVIEKLTGISAVTAALVESRQEFNSLKKVASISTVDESALAKLKMDRDELEVSIEKQTESVGEIRRKVSELKKSGVELRDNVAEESQKREAAEDRREELTVVSTKIESRESELERLTEDRKAQRKKLSLISSGTSLDEIEPKVNGLKGDLRAKELQSAKIDANLVKNRRKLQEYSKTVEGSDLETAEDVIVSRDAVQSVLQDTRDEISTQKASILSADSEMKKIAKAISVLTGGDGTCPTCLQHIDNVSAAVTVLDNEVTALNKSKDDSKSKILELQEVETSSKDSIAEHDLILEAITQSATLAKLIEEDSVSYTTLASDIITLESELKALEKVYNAAKRHEDIKNDYDRLLARSKTVSDEIEALNARKDEIEAELKNSGSISAAALAKLRIKLDEARAAHTKLMMTLTESKGELNLANERLLHLHEKIAKAEEEIKKYKDLLKSVEVASASTNLIEEFREERIRTSIPVIEVYASDLLSRFTEGKFTSLKIDGKFNTTVVLANGIERAVGLLSGGELSAASMALRLAISMLLNSGSSTNLIILDEVLVSQDAGRAELILSTVKDVCKGQVVLIAHNDSIDGIADKVVELSAS
jgi:exonuclease SbcC